MFEEWGYSLRYFIWLASKDAAKMMKLVEEEQVCHPGLLAVIVEQFPLVDAQEVSTEVCGHSMNSIKGEDLQAAKAAEDSQRLEARWKLTQLQGPPEHGEGCAVGGRSRQPSEVEHEVGSPPEDARE